MLNIISKEYETMIDEMKQGKDVNMGMFHDWVSCGIINSLINDALTDE